MHKTVVELDLVGYSAICDNLEQGLDVNTTAQLDQQIQSFIDTGLRAVAITREQAAMRTTGDGAVLVFDTAEVAHRFAQATHAATREHNRTRKQPLAKRIFRLGAATGEIVMKPRPEGGFEIAGMTIARAVRLEVKATPGGVLVDEATHAGLSADQRKQYGAKVLVAGKRDEEFEAYACQLNPDGPQDAAFFSAPSGGPSLPPAGHGTTAVKTASLTSQYPRRVVLTSLASAVLAGLGIWLWGALHDAGWQPVVNQSEVAFTLVRDVIVQDGFEPKLAEFSVRKPAPDEFNYRWRQGRMERIYHVQRDDGRVWNLSLVTAPDSAATPSGKASPGTRTNQSAPDTQPTNSPPSASENPDADPRAVKLLNDFMAALAMEDKSKRLQAVLPLLHKSLRSPQGNDLARSTEDSYGRAVQSVKFYRVPVQITRVARGNVTTVGLGVTAERGRSDRYFIGKRDGVAGMPAPIHVFFPANGQPPSLVNIGSL